MEAMTDTASDEARSDRRSGELTETVVTAVAEAKGVDPLDLEPLYTVIDPDALNGLFRPSVGTSPETVEVRFEMEGCRVVVRGGGEVTVTPPAETGEDSVTSASRLE